MNKENRQLVLNRIQTPDGTILVSRHRHDYVSYTDKNGEKYILDGGRDYVRTSINKEPAKELHVYSDDSHEQIREVFEWGTYGKNGDQPLTFKALKNLDTDHIEAILRTQKGLPKWSKDIFSNELEFRKKNI